MDEVEKVSIWDKKQADITLGDSMKVAVGITVAFTVLPVVIYGAFAGAVSLWERRQTRKAEKALEQNDN
jgi:hypothetical protein